MTLGERVRRLRDDRGWFQLELSQRAGIGLTTLRDLEQGRHAEGYPKLSTIQRLASAFGVSVGELLGDESRAEGS